ncbi:Transcriptional regulatory protein TdiR [compost metagenome]|jgi:FixJ family two-component response regulator
MQDTHARNTTIISVVDDEESVRTALESLLRSNGHEVQTYSNALDFLQSSGPFVTHCLISDIQMPGMSGVEMCQVLVARGIRLPVILITGHPEARQPADTNALNLVAVLSKPFRSAELLACMESALQKRT